MLSFLKETEDIYEYLLRTGKPVVIYGMGNGADKVFDVFKAKGIDISAVFASDDFVRGQVFRGFKVKRFLEIQSEFDDFTMVPAFATCIPDVMQRIESLDEKYDLRFPELPVIGKEPMDRLWFLKNERDIIAAGKLFYDDFSRKVYEGLLNFRFSGKLKYIREITTKREEAFSLMNMTKNEVYADFGAYDGDTIRELADITGGYKSVLAVEPDRRNYRKLCAFCEKEKNITPVNCAVSDKSGVLRFNDKAGRNSSFDEDGRAEVSVKSPDELFSLYDFSDVGYVKMDVEGAEEAALLGMKNTIKNVKPKLAVSAYHRSCDVFALPLLIKKLNPEYCVSLRKHPYYPGWETSVYCW